MSIASYLFTFLVSFISCFEHTVDAGYEREPGLIYDIVMAAHVYGDDYGISPNLLLSLSFLESKWNPGAGCEDERDSCGLYQQLPQYSGAFSDTCWNERSTCNEDYEAAEISNDLWLATRIAARHMNSLISRESSINMALERYHWGNIVDENDMTYSNSVLRYRRQIFE